MDPLPPPKFFWGEEEKGRKRKKSDNSAGEGNDSEGLSSEFSHHDKLHFSPDVNSKPSKEFRCDVRSLFKKKKTYDTKPKEFICSKCGLGNPCNILSCKRSNVTRNTQNSQGIGAKKISTNEVKPKKFVCYTCGFGYPCSPFSCKTSKVTLNTQNSKVINDTKQAEVSKNDTLSSISASAMKISFDEDKPKKFVCAKCGFGHPCSPFSCKRSKVTLNTQNSEVIDDTKQAEDSKNDTLSSVSASATKVSLNKDKLKVSVCLRCGTGYPCRFSAYRPDGTLNTENSEVIDDTKQAEDSKNDTLSSVSASASKVSLNEDKPKISLCRRCGLECRCPFSAQRLNVTLNTQNLEVIDDTKRAQDAKNEILSLIQEKNSADFDTMKKMSMNVYEPKEFKCFRCGSGYPCSRLICRNPKPKEFVCSMCGLGYPCAPLWCYRPLLKLYPQDPKAAKISSNAYAIYSRYQDLPPVYHQFDPPNNVEVENDDYTTPSKESPQDKLIRKSFPKLILKNLSHDEKKFVFYTAKSLASESEVAPECVEVSVRSDDVNISNDNSDTVIKDNLYASLKSCLNDEDSFENVDTNIISTCNDLLDIVSTVSLLASESEVAPECVEMSISSDNVNISNDNSDTVIKDNLYASYNLKSCLNDEDSFENVDTNIISTCNDLLDIVSTVSLVSEVIELVKK